MNLNDIGNNLHNLWNQGTQAVSNVGNAVSNEVRQLPQQVQQVAQPVEQAVQHIQIPQVQVPNFSNLASSFGQHLQQATNTVGSTIGNQSLLNIPQVPNLPRPTIAQGVNTAMNVIGGQNNNPTNNPVSALLAGKVQNIPGIVNKDAQTFNQEVSSIGAKNATPQQKQGQQNLIMGMVGGGAPQGKVSQNVIDNATQALTHNLGAMTGDVTRTFNPQEIAGAIEQLKGKQLTGDAFTDNAIKLANFLDAAKKGVTQNLPTGAGLSVGDIRNGKTIAKDSTTQYADTGTVPTQAAIRARVGQPNPAEQASINDFENNVLGGKNVENFNPDMGVQTNNPNIKVKAPPENPNGGVAAVNPQEVAGQARLARSGTMQNIQFRAQTLASQMDQVLKTPEENLNIRLALESPEKMDYYANQSSNPQAFKQIAQQYSDFTDHVAQQINASGNKMNVINNYFTHIWDLSTPEAQKTWNDLMAANAKNFQSGFTKQRIVQTIEEGLGKGLDLANPKASQDVIQYANSMGMQAGAGAFNKTINNLRPRGAVPFSANGTVPYNYEGKLFQQSNIPGNQGTFIDPELQQYMGHYNPSGFADNPVIAGKDVMVGDTKLHVPGVDQLNQLDKETKLALGGFHSFNTSLRMAANNPTVIPSAIRSMFDMGYRNQMAQKAIDDGVIDFGTKHGVTFSSSGDVLPQGATTMQNIQSKNPITKFNNALFGGMVNTYKLNLVRGMMKQFPNADTDPIVAKQAQEYGKQINDLMGGLNYEAMGRNKTVQQALRLVGLAPDFTEGTLHQLFTAANPSGYANVTTRPAAIFALRNVIGQVAIYAGLAELGRRLTTGSFSPDFKSFVANSILNPNIPLPNNATFNNPKTGKTQSAFLPASEFNTLAKGVTDPAHFLQARGSGIVSAGGSLLSGKDYYGNPLVNPFGGQQDNLQNRAAALLPNQLPIPVQQIMKATQKTQVTSNPNAPKVPIQTPTTTALNIAGFRVANNPNDPKTIAQQKYFNGLNQAAQTLNPNDQKIFLGQIHPTTKDADGNPVVDKTPLLSPAKYDTLLSNPTVLAAEVKFQQGQPSHDPLWDLPPAQLKAYMQAQVISKNDPGGDKATVNALYGAIPQSFYNQRTQYFNQLVSSGQMSQQAVNPYKVAANPAVSQFWTDYFKLPAGSAQRKAMITSPLGQQALAQTQQQTQLTNQQRIDMGLPLLAGSSGSAYKKYTKKVSIAKVPVAKMATLSSTKKSNKSMKLGTSKTNSIKVSKQSTKQPSLKPLKIVAGSSPKAPKSFKVTTPRILLSTSGGSQRGVRKQAGISIPRTRRKVPYLTV